MIIRKMVADDYEQAEALFQKLHNMHVEAELDMYKKQKYIHKKRAFKKMIKSAEYVLLCAEDNGQIMGVCKTRLCTSGMTTVKIAYLDALYVSNEHRGKGIGKKLFFETEKIAKANGAKRLDLTVWEFNSQAIAFYKSLGMKAQRYTFEKELL